MIDWSQGRKQVADLFFEDEIELYVNAITQNSLGEEIERPVLVGAYKCNVENQQSTVKYTEVGASAPQALRISLTKDALLEYENTYKIKIKKARLTYNSKEWWKVDGWVEGQLSTVIAASREVRI